MEIYDTIIEIIDVNLIYCLIPLLFTLILIEAVFKNRFKTKPVLNLIKWIIICYSIVTLIRFFIGIILFPEESAFLNRATGPYWWGYWLMFLSATLLPFTLFYKKLASKPFYVIFIALFMKIGWYLERFEMIVISYHRDYLPDSWSSDGFFFPMKGILMLILQGIILAIILLGVFELMERKKMMQNNSL